MQWYIWRLSTTDLSLMLLPGYCVVNMAHPRLHVKAHSQYEWKKDTLSSNDFLYTPSCRTERLHFSHTQYAQGGQLKQAIFVKGK
jgi:hypothetical protein